MISCQLQCLNFLFGKGGAETRALSHAQMQIWRFRKKIDQLHGVKQKKKKKERTCIALWYLVYNFWLVFVT